jgi:molybdopterin-guanine dinucleotide biosynthesis protein A
MGADKSFVVVDGRPMAVAVCDALWEGGCSPVECQGGDVERLTTLGLVAVPDSDPGSGPVAAIVDALVRTAGPVVVAACDLPGLDAETVRAIDAVEAPVVFARHDGRAHLVSKWSIEALDTLNALLEGGRQSYQGALEAVGATAVDVSPAVVRNVNTPDDLDA